MNITNKVNRADNFEQTPEERLFKALRELYQSIL